jgi:hypothetical protein
MKNSLPLTFIWPDMLWLLVALPLLALLWCARRWLAAPAGAATCRRR